MLKIHGIPQAQLLTGVSSLDELIGKLQAIRQDEGRNPVIVSSLVELPVTGAPYPRGFSEDEKVGLRKHVPQ